MKKILVVVAHPDDEILGAGGTIGRHADSGDIVHGVYLTNGVSSRKGTTNADIRERHQNAFDAFRTLGCENIFFREYPDNKMDTIPLLNIVQDIESAISKIQPEIIYTHWEHDLNVDHQITYRAVLTATRPHSIGGCVKSLYSFEIASSSEWSFEQTFNPNVFVELTKEQLKRKIDAMRCYKSELRESNHPRSIEYIRRRAEYWGPVSGVKYAEAFRLIRQIV